MNQKNCRSCTHLDFNEMTDEMYCKLNDYEPIRLRWCKRRPDWCPLVVKPSIQLEPCDFCKHNPPSSTDEKPCSMCPAERKVDNG